MAKYPFHEEVQQYFPDFDYRQVAPGFDASAIRDMRNPANKTGHQQRAFSCWWAINKCSPMDLCLDLGSPRGMTPYAIHVDIFGDGRQHPFYGGEYKAELVWDAANIRQVCPPNNFPLVLSNHSLEHMPSVGDAGVVDILSRWVELLRVDGVLAMVIPDNGHFDVMGCDKDHRHAWSAADFRPRVLDPLLARGGVALMEYDTLDNHFSFNVVLRKTS